MSTPSPPPDDDFDVPPPPDDGFGGGYAPPLAARHGGDAAPPSQLDSLLTDHERATLSKAERDRLMFQRAAAQKKSDEEATRRAEEARVAAMTPEEREQARSAPLRATPSGAGVAGARQRMRPARAG